MSSVISMMATARPAAVRVSGSMSVGEVELPSRDCRHYGAHLGLEYATWDRVKSDLRLVACIDPLQGILIERCRQLLITLAGIDERHGGSKLRRNDVHAGSQGDLGHKSRSRRTDRCLVEIELGIGKFCTPLRHRGVHTADVCRIGEARALLFGFRRQGLFCSVQVSGVGVE